jgi:cholesterol oxidase
MARLSSSAGNVAPEYPIVVVGSGYGGGIAASRLARAGQRVCVLERGREYLRGEFPDTEVEAARETQATLPHQGVLGGRLGSPLALLDFHVDKEINVLRGCGLGGTSLINANVALEADPKVFADPRWPPELIADLDTRLQEGYRHAREVLDPKPYPEDWPQLAKLEAHRKSAEAMGERFVRVPINVSFEDKVNPFGVEQPKCNLCGDCTPGCNVGAKTTVAVSYLADAWNHGAEIFTEISVDRIAARTDGKWDVHYTLVGAGRERFEPRAEMVVVAKVVILAAGTLGSTEILLRSRAAGLSLSDRLGYGFSGNADVLGFGYNTDQPIHGVGIGSRDTRDHEPVGPTITCAIEGRTPDRPLAEQFIIEDAALPAALEGIYPSTFRAAALTWGTDTDFGLADEIAERRRVLTSRLRGAYHGAVAHTQTFLGMGVDSGKGQMYLDGHGRFRIAWPGVEHEPIISNINAKMHDATAALGGTWIPNPLWHNHLESRLITVHPLGGCSMGVDAEAGVTNHKGQVFAGPSGEAVHDNLYVADGSVIPVPLGVNPLLTISAVAERNIALLAEREGWTIPYELHHRPSTPRPVPGRIGVGVRFTERMAGFVGACPELFDPSDQARYRAACEAAFAGGEAAGSTLAFILTLISDDLDGTLADPYKRMRFDGVVEAPSLAPAPLQVSDGWFQLLSEDPHELNTTNMIYEMVLTAEDGRRWSFRGVKFVHDDPGFDLWSDTTTLYVDVRPLPATTGTGTGMGTDPGASDPSVGEALRGILRIAARDFRKQLRTMAVIGTESKLEKIAAMVKFGRFFAGSLFETYADVFAHPVVFDPKAPARLRRPLRVDPPSIHYFFTSDGEQLCLTRYRGGNKGPVMLVHGLGVSSGIFTVDTIDTNLTEYLVAHGYDVWLLDYRASIDLPGSGARSNGDQVATIDLPEAVAKVRELTGAVTIQMVVHCFGATTFFMSALAGKLPDVRAAVASQVAAHVDAATIVRLKSGLHMPQVLEKLGVESMTAYTDTEAPWYERLYNRALAVYPVEEEERCDSATCHRVSFMYSLLYEHDQLAVATHDTLHELFGVANIEAFEHLAQIVRRKHVVDAAGKDVYMPGVGHLGYPIRFIHGAQNACYLPSSTEKTLEWLREHNDPSLYSRVVIPDFGHIDCIFGKHAATAVYPHILEHLENNL